MKNTHPTCRDIITQYHPDYLDKLQTKYILNVSYYITERVECFGSLHFRDISDYDENFAFDTLDECREYAERRAEEIREEIADEQKHNRDIVWSYELRYTAVEAVVLDADDELDSDLYEAEFPSDPTRKAYFEWGDLRDTETLEDQNWHGED